jgi:hypothetical protein
MEQMEMVFVVYLSKFVVDTCSFDWDPHNAGIDFEPIGWVDNSDNHSEIDSLI